MKTGPGRPLPPELRNSCQYRLTMTPEVSAQLEALTRHYGKPKSEVLRECISALHETALNKAGAKLVNGNLIFGGLGTGKDSQPQ